MTRKQRRLAMVVACGLGLGSAATLSLFAFSSSMELFLTPSEVSSKLQESGRTFRLGGLVEAGSLQHGSDRGEPTARFRVSDGNGSVEVAYTGILPDLFREGQGIVALGKIQPDGTFRAEEVLAKHDESYMPKEVVEALKKSGHWDPSQGPPPPAATWNDLTTASAKRAGG
ncbi:MAG TPA: cytochrome c maturation protein CcmE [Acetobacteraceae bacterium]|jgi:cytochrome c-type biogenesis protein CcmE|nr:cytochrome c maturation protein CcmE [Acetobacteraceae bacterium]